MRNPRRCPGRLATIATIVVLGAARSPVAAQCLFDRPTAPGGSKTARFESTLVQGFVICSDFDYHPNTTTQGGLPACKPPETWDDLAGFSANGWRFDQFGHQSWGRVRLDRVSGAFTNPPGTRDMRVRLWLKKIVDNTGLPASGTGSLSIFFRATFNDPVNGDLTMSDFGTSAQFTLTNGTVDPSPFTTTLGAMLNAQPLPRLPDCASIEVLYLEVRDENGHTFAVPGVRIIP